MLSKQWGIRNDFEQESDIQLVIGMLNQVSMQSEEENEEAGAKETRQEAVQAGRKEMAVIAHVWGQLSSRKQRKRAVFKGKLYLEGY